MSEFLLLKALQGISYLNWNLFCHQNTLSIIFWCTEALYTKRVFLKLCFHSSVALISSNIWQLVSGKKKKKKKEGKTKLKAFLSSTRTPSGTWEELTFIFQCHLATMSPCYPKTGLYRVPGMGNLQEEYAKARGCLIQVLKQPVSFMLFQITETEQKERQPGPQQAKNLKHCQLHGAGLYMPVKILRHSY